MIPMYENEQKTIIDILKKEILITLNDDLKNSLYNVVAWKDEANLYFEAANKLMNNGNKFTIPACLLLFYSCEIGLKALIRLSDKEPKKIHKLNLLFNDIDDVHQNGIFEMFQGVFRIHLVNSKRGDADPIFFMNTQYAIELKNEIDQLTLDIFKLKIEEYFGDKNYFIAIRYNDENTSEYSIYGLVLNALAMAIKYYCADVIVPIKY